MSISYSYEIIAVNEAAKCMEVVYTADGHQTMHIGARLPREGETLESIIESFSPVAYWLDQQKQVIVPQVGLTGMISNKLYSEVDAEGTVVKDKFTKNPQHEVAVGNRLVEDTPVAPVGFNSATQRLVRTEPVVGNVAEYTVQNIADIAPADVPDVVSLGDILA